MMTTAASSRTVLIACTSIAIRSRLVDAVRQSGHQTLEATRTSELIDLVDSNSSNLDLLLLDLGLASGDKLPLVRRIREYSGKLPIIVFSGSITSAEDVRELSKLGVKDYLNEHLESTQVLPSLAPHLFPDSFNRRSSPRVVLTVPVSYLFDNTITGALTLNISKDGLAVRTMNPLEVSIQVCVRFRLPGSIFEIDAHSRVVWSDQRVGMGLQFERVDLSAQATIDEYIDNRHGNEANISKTG